MKTRMDRIAIVAGLGASALVLAACQSGGGSLDSETGGDGAALVVPTSQAPWNPAYEEVVRAFEESTGRTVDLRPFPNPDVKTQQINDIQSQQQTFDVFQVNEADVGQFNANGWLQAFTDVDPDYVPDEEIYSYSNIARYDADGGVFSPEGDITLAPLLGNVDIFTYRTDIYDELGLDVPATWEELIDNSETIQESGLVPYGGVYRTQGTPGAYEISYEFQALINGAGGSWFVDPGVDWTPNANTPEAVRAGEWLRELAATGPEATTTVGQAQVIATLQAGDAGQSYVVAAAAAGLEDEANSSVAGRMGYAPLPPTPTGDSSSATGLWTLGIPAGLPQERAEAALEYIDWMTSQEAMEIFAANGGIPVRSDAYEQPDLSPAAQEVLSAVQGTVSELPEVPTSLRYNFGPEVLNVMEGPLQAIAAGTTSPEDGMAEINAGLEDIVEEQDLPTR